MKKLSVVIITFNEEKQISRCIDSVEAFADEIVVVDSYSTDATKSICRKKNVVFIEHSFEGYIAQKNYALTHATHRYVLSLDADEAASETMRQSIEKEKACGFSADGYEFNRLTNYCGKWIKHGTWYPDRKLRLFDHFKGQWEGMDPHDRYEMTNRHCAAVRLPGDILHYSYGSISDHIQQFDKFSGILANEMHGRNRRALLANLLINPSVTFLKSYVVRLGMLDGYYGFIIAAFSAFASFAKYAKLRELNKK